jgi:hypothetical protein
MGVSKTSYAWLWIGLATVLAGCHRTPAEQAVREAIVAATDAAEHVDAGAFADHLTADFTGNAGDLDRPRLEAMLRLARLRHVAVHAVVGPVAMEARGERYLARFTVTLTRGGDLLPSDIGVYVVESAWRREGRDWRCYSATWHRSM